jgi:hypothetical protein
VGALGPEQLRGGKPYAAVPAGNQSDLVLKYTHFRITLSAPFGVLLQMPCLSSHPDCGLAG